MTCNIRRIASPGTGHAVLQHQLTQLCSVPIQRFARRNNHLASQLHKGRRGGATSKYIVAMRAAAWIARKASRSASMR
jgi:hypothetical protein